MLMPILSPCRRIFLIPKYKFTGSTKISLINYHEKNGFFSALNIYINLKQILKRKVHHLMSLFLILYIALCLPPTSGRETVKKAQVKTSKMFLRTFMCVKIDSFHSDFFFGWWFTRVNDKSRSWKLCVCEKPQINLKKWQKEGRKNRNNKKI